MTEDDVSEMRKMPNESMKLNSVNVVVMLACPDENVQKTSGILDILGGNENGWSNNSCLEAH
jgi:hypothetical protein